ncbi:hypothetical protein O181_028881 [Austropuccinia psidii MF-1]|uniref:CCHC-type domain-containing protein n=1 Tax=Austropuccinia psidii MF-1 TaxID=1389203 RepID=A0A9Q3CQ28_9BASI|nr:hypothetical protein [Austropuccinia psidii MF-1]
MDQALQLNQLLKDIFQWGMDNKRLNLASHWEELGASFQKICLKEINFKELMEITKGWNPTRQFRLLEERETRIRENQATIQAMHQQISDQDSPLFTIRSSFQEKTRIQGKKQDLFQPKAERVEPNAPEAVVLGERSIQNPDTAVNTTRISSPTNRNITPTQTEHKVVTPEKSLDYFKRLNKGLQRNALLQVAKIKAIQESCAQLSKASEETHKRLNQVFEEQHHCKRDRDCLDQYINKLFNVYQNMKPQPEGHDLENPYHQEDIKPDALLVNKARSPSKYQDGDNMSYSEKEALKPLPEASSWPKFFGTGEYDHMELIDYIDVPSIPDCWITSRLNTAFKGHASIWYTEMKEIHGRRNWPWLQIQIIQKHSNDTWILQNTMSFENDKYSVEKAPYKWCLRQSKRLQTIDPQMNIQMRNHKFLTQMPGELENAVKCIFNQNCTLHDIASTLQDVRKRKNIGKYSPYKSSGFREKQPFRVELKDKPRERVAGVTMKKNYCHNCGSTDHYSNNCPKAKKKVYAIEKVLEEESPTEDSESDSMGDAIREKSSEDQDLREEFLVECQEETPLEIRDIQLESGMSHDTVNKNLYVITHKMHRHS